MYYGLTFIITLVALHNVTSREKAGFVSLVKSLIHGWLKMVMTTSAGRLLQWGENVFEGALIHIFTKTLFTG